MGSNRSEGFGITPGITPLVNDPEWSKVTRLYPEICLNGVNTQCSAESANERGPTRQELLPSLLRRVLRSKGRFCACEPAGRCQAALVSRVSRRPGTSPIKWNSPHTVDGRNPAPAKKPWNDHSPVNSNKQWFVIVS